MEVHSYDFYELYPNTAFALHSVKLIGIGILMFGLLIGSLYFLNFLYRLWCMPKSSREYRENSQFMVRENLIRYFITIGCILTLEALLFYNFEDCEKAMYIGAALWSAYLGFFYLRDKLRQIRKGQNLKI